MSFTNDALSVDVDLDIKLHQFRYNSELKNGAKGGYLSGKVKFHGIPENAKIRELMLNIVS